MKMSKNMAADVEDEITELAISSHETDKNTQQIILDDLLYLENLERRKRYQQRSCNNCNWRQETQREHELYCPIERTKVSEYSGTCSDYDEEED